MTKPEKFIKSDFKDLTFNLEKIEFEDILQTTNPIIFDTNFLFVTFEFKIDAIAEIKRVIGGTFNLYIYEGTIEELSNIEKKNAKNKKFLPLIAKMLLLYDFKIIKSNQTYVDDQILENSNSKIIIATNDGELRKTLWSKGFRVMFMRQKSYFAIN